MRRLLFTGFLCVSVSCTCGAPGLDELRFACASDDECVDGFRCIARECALPGSELDSGLTDSGFVAGVPDSGAPDSGAPDSGAPDSGTPDSGAPDSGTPDAGRPDAGSDAGAPWNPAWAFRRKLSLASGSAAAPAGYTVQVSFDHQALVTSAKSRADGADVRIVCRAGNAWLERDRSLDTGSGFNTSTTRLWFRYPVAVNAMAVDDRCYLHYGNPAAGAPPANPTAVFLYFDGFESGDLSRWLATPGLWATTSVQKHRGNFAVRYTTENDGVSELVANPALDVADVYLDGWWFTDDVNLDVSALVREDVDAGNNYQTNLEGAAGWDIAKRLQTNWSELVENESTPVANTWMRVGLAIAGTRLRVFHDGVQVNPRNGTGLDVGTELTRGNIGFSKWFIPANSAWYVDDVTARAFVDPEPVVTAGAEE